MGEMTVDFSGYVRVARSKPSCDEWNNAEVYTNLRAAQAGSSGQRGAN
jgi:hypothetical protein